MTDLRKIIRKARNFPDAESWAIDDPVSFEAARLANIASRPECTRHMDPQIRARVVADDVFSDVRFYRTHTAWRYSSPVIYWAAHDLDLAGHPEIVDRVGPYAHRWPFFEVRRDAARFRSMEEWRSLSPKGYRTAVRRQLLDHPGILAALKG